MAMVPPALSEWKGCSRGWAKKAQSLSYLIDLFVDETAGDVPFLGPGREVRAQKVLVVCRSLDRM
jgi:hypothetical protein